jgi:SAM-dependent methyltransferase
MIDRSLLRDMLRIYPAQPATAVWRAVEVGALLRLGIPEGRGLDLGCGDGKLTSVILERSGPRALVGVDVDSQETQAAGKATTYQAVHTAPADQIPEREFSFDFVLSNSVLEHIPDLNPVLREIARLLRPGGRFLFTVPAPGFHANLRGSLLPWVTRDRYLRQLDIRLAHVRYPSAADWHRLCDAVGLSLGGCLGYLDRNETRMWEMLSRCTGGLLYGLWGKRRPPIRIQRQLGLRGLQNRLGLPATVAAGLATIICNRLRGETDAWLPEHTAGCLLVYGVRR